VGDFGRGPILEAERPPGFVVALQGGVGSDDEGSLRTWQAVRSGTGRPA
jgi:hypothetical protein